MSTTGNSTTASDITAPWVKSSYSGPQGNCVEVARLADGKIAVRNSRHPDGPALIFTRTEWDAFISGARDGQFGEPA
jgi:hypothetical protein